MVVAMQPSVQQWLGMGGAVNPVELGVENYH